MLSFTEEIKNEISSDQLSERRTSLALLSAFLRTSGTVVSKNGTFGFELTTENERTAEFISDMIETVFGITLTVTAAKFDLLSGKDKLSFESVGEKAEKLLKELCVLGEDDEGKFLIFGIDDRLFPDEECEIAFIRGAFLGGGSCTVPEDGVYSSTGYHFEIIFPNKRIAGDFCELLCNFEILAKLVARKDSAVVYVKSKEVISDLLDCMSCHASLEKLNKVVEKKEKQNNLNRVNNCSVSNIDKTLTASVKQVRAIEIISQTIGLQSLDKQLFDVAECRLADKNASMQELADRLHISKSCLNHRIRRIIELSRSLQD